MARIFKWSTAVLLMILLIMALLVVWLMATESGLRFAVKQAEPYLSVESLQGSAGNFKADGLVIDTEGAKIKIGGVQLAWHPLSIIKREVLIDLLAVEQVEISLTTVEANKTEVEPWSGTHLPVNVSLNDLKAKSIALSLPSGSSYTINDAQLSAKITNNILELESLTVEGEGAKLDLSGKADLSAKSDGLVNIKLNADYRNSELLLHSELDGAFEGTWEQLELKSVIKADKLKADNTREEAQIDVDIEGQLSSVLSDKPNFNLSANWQIPFNFFLEQEDLQEGLREGLVEPLQGSGQLHFDGQPDHYQFSLMGNTHSSDQAKLHFQLSGNGDLSHVLIPEIKIQSPEAKKLGEVNIKANSELDWADTLKWVFAGELIDFAPSLLIPIEANLVSALSGKIQSRGSLDPNASNLAGMIGYLNIESLSGRVFDKALTLDLGTSFEADTISLETVAIKGSGLQLSASGRIADHYAIDWSASVRDMSELSTKFAGNVNADGQLLGKLEDPELKLKVTAAQLAIFDDSKAIARAGALDLGAHLAWPRGDSPLNLKLKLNEIEQESQSFLSDLAFEIQGSASQHRMDLVAKNQSQVAFSTQVSAQLDNPAAGFSVDDLSWQAQLKSLIASMGEVGNLSLVAPSELTLSNSGLELKKTCLDMSVNNDEAARVDGGLSSICAAANYDSASNRQHASLKLQSIDLKLFQSLLKEQGIQIEGVLNGDMEYQLLSKSDAPAISVNLIGEGLKIGLPLPSGSSQVRPDKPNDIDREASKFHWLNFTKSTFTLEQQQALVSKIDFMINEKHRLQGELHSKKAVALDDWQQQIVKGSVDLAWGDLSLIPSELIGNSRLQGAVTAQLEIAGNLSKPELALNANVANASFYFPITGVDYQDIDINIRTDQSLNSTFAGQIKMGDGALNLGGEINFSEFESPSGKITLKGQQLTLMNTPEIEAVGELDLSLAMVDRVTDLGGDINIERAKLSLGKSESVILASDDVVLLGQEDQAPPSTQRLSLSIDLGEETHLTAAGLSADLEGELKILQNPGEIMLGQGQIDVKNGVYEAYGEELSISKGQLIFNSASVDNPALDLEATREIDQDIVGVRVQGMAQAPTLTLFSDPTYSDQDILSMLIFGKPLSGLGGEDSLTLLRIAASLRGNGPDRLTRVTNQLQNALGLSSLEIKLDGNSPELVAGKQLSDRFYVGYGYGLLDAAQAFILRYKINDAWSLQGDIGEDSGADLRYQIER